MEKKICAWKRGGSQEMKRRKAVKEKSENIWKIFRKYPCQIARCEVGGRSGESRFHEKLLNNES